MTRRRNKLLFDELQKRILTAGDVGEVFNQAYELTSDVALKYNYPDEVAQDAALKVAAKVDRFGSLASDAQQRLATTITKNTFLDMVRAQNKREQSTLDSFWEHYHGSDESEVLDDMVIAEWQHAHDDWLGQHSPADQTIWSLRTEGLSLQEIAERVQMPKSTVSYRIDNLKESYSQHFDR